MKIDDQRWGFVGQQRRKRKHPFKMVMEVYVAVSVAVRIFEVNADDSVAGEIFKLLNTVRSIVLILI